MPDTTTEVPVSRRFAINAEWFGKLRWVAAAGQLLTIAVVTGALEVAAPVAALLVLVGVTVVSNALFGWWRVSRRESPPTGGEWIAVLVGLMTLDLVVLTAMLALTGGPTNPFVVFYFVNLALSGVVLPTRWAWALGVAAVAVFGLLTYAHQPLDELRDPTRLRSLAELLGEGVTPPPLVVVGAWVAFAACAAVIVNFTTRLTNELGASERLRRRAEQRRARAEKLEALGTLAAGAAHELATPLSTIAVATTEALRSLERAEADEETLEDLALIRREVDRCRTIIDRMRTDSGQATAAAPERVVARALLEEVVGGIAARERVAVCWPSVGGETAEELELLAPRVALAQAIRAVVQNALDASPPGEAVRLAVDRLADTLRVTIADRGPGMPAEVLRRAGEPFFTTKAPGDGMGLGLFLARSVVERLEGSLRLESPEEGGAVVTIVLPLAESEEERHV